MLLQWLVSVQEKQAFPIFQKQTFTKSNQINHSTVKCIIL